MRVIGVLLILLGAFGLFAGANMYGDIGIAGMIAGGAALLSGIGFMLAAGKIDKVAMNK